MGKKQPQIHFIFRLRYRPASQQAKAKAPYVTDVTKTEAIATTNVAYLLDEVSLFLYVSLSKLMHLSHLGTSL
jgi:hypothetical protein